MASPARPPAGYDSQRDRQIETNIPQRLDRLPWSSWHTVVIIALGITWLLDGLEVTLAGSLASTLKDKHALGLSDVQVGASATGYLAGAVAGALIFGWLTDRLGRKKLFFVTLALYLAATAATAFSWNFWSFLLFRVLTGSGIGGEIRAFAISIFYAAGTLAGGCRGADPVRTHYCFAFAPKPVLGLHSRSRSHAHRRGHGNPDWRKCRAPVARVDLHPDSVRVRTRKFP